MTRTVLITGGAKGIGAACAEHFACLGCNVVINYFTSETSAENLQKELSDRGYNVLTVKADVSSKPQVEKMFELADKTFGGVDILINNAGISKIGIFNDFSEEDYDNIFDVNMKSAYLCSKYAVSHMLKKHWGRIINISSMWGLVGASCEVPYSASKAALIGFTKSLAKELAPSGITVNSVAPGFIDTDMNAHISEQDRTNFIESIPISRAGTPMEVAHAAAFFADERSSYITGQVLAVDGGFTC